MTILYSYAENDGTTPTLTTVDPEQIREVLATAGIDFEQWSTVEVSDTDSPEQILTHYAQWLGDLKQRGGYSTADVIAVMPDNPQRAALREKFLEEHTHSEDEVRFFVAGRGAFYLHIGDRVLVVVCEQGDLLQVPANTQHWFDMGPEPKLVAIRIFTRADGWVARFTGNQISQRFPRLEPRGLPLG